MNDKQQLQEMGLHLSEQQAKGLADAFAESDFAGELVPMQEGGLCMAKQIEDLQARLQECANGAAKMQEQRDNLADLLYRTELGAGALKRLKSACVVMGISTPESIEELGAYQARYVSMLIDEAHDVCGLARDYDVQRQQLSAQLEAANRKIAVMAELLREVIVRDDFDREDGDSAGRLLYRIDAALAGNPPDHVVDASKMVPDGCAMLYVGNGMFARCDWEDWPIVMGYWWHLSTERGSTRYAQAHDSHDTSKRKRIAMHRLILSAGDGDIVDHINGDGLDNRRSNLRIVTSQQNAFNQKHHGGSSRYKGVSYRADTRTWRAYITMGGRRRYLGNFASEDDAANAYNKEAAKLFGEHAKLNSVASKPEQTK